MRNVIYKYPLKAPISVLEMPESFQAVLVAEQHGDITVWLELDPAAPTELTTFYVVPTGAPIPPNTSHLGSVIMGEFVWHVYCQEEE